MISADRVESLDAPADIAAEAAAGIAGFLRGKAAEFADISPDTAEIGDSLIAYTRGGKRIRPVLLWWGYQMVAGSELAPGSQARTGLAEAAASLELLHAAALIHDDVIDHSDTRRGAPALHRQFEALHSALGYEGDGEAFGVSAAIVIGDICLALSEELFESAQDRLGASVPAQRLRQQMRRDVMVGQFLDVRAEVIPLDDARIGERAWEVLSFKSAKYSVEQPLLLGAALGGADDNQLAALSRFGLPLGQAFQLRDDVLGIVGDPSATGKPAGDDIREGKRTVLIAESLARMDREQADLLASRLGDPDLSAETVAETVAMLRTVGGLDAVEEIIADRHAAALSELSAWSGGNGAAFDLGEGARSRLTSFADALSYRQR
ncbi:polyprenyl synthetase family protein [Brevibacterium casei]|uniref:Farnesyl diphosphate synthase n=1 Tax=Brevibacterium casei TaxID=33889 RepID=A0A449D4M6_9MICO|nr:polyprenyl synthetase family protein [Brevibacterium casei]MCT1551519.1 polyprenyl synthetase family protein [Brevibacterium casei]MCT1560914.1 polyprenyl synthetase family protein [Brevibacterium casei]MCT2209278.1 polyprenyl synthetase family protein [Brevibacterium casei]QPS33106.1 polyprenyl synthetase family protein [Brevibacterium casei]VEW12473.1 Farnesyl diphosphate synthase [Brevibacterium casei]